MLKKAPGLLYGVDIYTEIYGTHISHKVKFSKLQLKKKSPKHIFKIEKIHVDCTVRL